MATSSGNLSCSASSVHWKTLLRRQEKTNIPVRNLRPCQPYIVWLCADCASSISYSKSFSPSERLPSFTGAVNSTTDNNWSYYDNRCHQTMPMLTWIKLSTIKSQLIFLFFFYGFNSWPPERQEFHSATEKSSACKNIKKNEQVRVLTYFWGLLWRVEKDK